MVAAIVQFNFEGMYVWCLDWWKEVWRRRRVCFQNSEIYFDCVHVTILTIVALSLWSTRNIAFRIVVLIKWSADSLRAWWSENEDADSHGFWRWRWLFLITSLISFCYCLKRDTLLIGHNSTTLAVSRMVGQDRSNISSRNIQANICQIVAANTAL